MTRFTSILLVWGLAGLCTLFAAQGPSGTGTPAPAGGDSTAPAQVVPGGVQETQETAQQANWLSFLFPLIILVAFMYFVMIRPQKKEQAKRQAMLNEIKVGEKVVTIGGLHGTVKRCGENDVDIEVADGVCMTFNLGAIHERIADQSAKKE